MLNRFFSLVLLLLLIGCNGAHDVPSVVSTNTPAGINTSQNGHAYVLKGYRNFKTPPALSSLRTSNLPAFRKYFEDIHYAEMNVIELIVGNPEDHDKIFQETIKAVRQFSDHPGKELLEQRISSTVVFYLLESNAPDDILLEITSLMADNYIGSLSLFEESLDRLQQSTDPQILASIVEKALTNNPSEHSANSQSNGPSALREGTLKEEIAGQMNKMAAQRTDTYARLSALYNRLKLEG